MKIGVIGAGVMGSGIAQVSALAGYDTVLFDISSEALETAQNRIKKNISKGVELGKVTEDAASSAHNRLKYTSKLSEVKVDLVIEAIVEKIEVKLKVFNDLAEVNGASTTYASNTSSIPLTKIAAGFKFPERVVGIHFFNPAHIMKLVEVIRAEQSSDEVVEIAMEYVKSVGKKSILAKDAPGFIVNRVARHFYVESLKILEEDVADHEQIDTLIESLGFKMGPFRLMDLIGVETNLSVTESMYELFNFDQKFRPNRIQQKKAQAGYYGRKSGKGFYTYDS
ncbi:3-hydroxybutyryl-CoA dehydrogenase [bacterium]|nr:3-hydroxybutyryl-CoA dehydrogenase [bacterium]